MSTVARRAGSAGGFSRNFGCSARALSGADPAACMTRLSVSLGKRRAAGSEHTFPISAMVKLDRQRRNAQRQQTPRSRNIVRGQKLMKPRRQKGQKVVAIAVAGVTPGGS